MITDEGEQLSEYEDVLLSKRNTAWISGMKTMMEETPTFFAVGAGHLAGKKGVINLLKKEGYKLSPISHPHRYRPTDVQSGEAPGRGRNPTDVRGSRDRNRPLFAARGRVADREICDRRDRALDDR